MCASVTGALEVDEAEHETETARLHALVDGLCVHAVMSPDRLLPARIRRIIARHLESLRPSGHRRQPRS